MAAFQLLEGNYQIDDIVQLEKIIHIFARCDKAYQVLANLSGCLLDSVCDDLVEDGIAFGSLFTPLHCTRQIVLGLVTYCYCSRSVSSTFPHT